MVLECRQLGYASGVGPRIQGHIGVLVEPQDDEPDREGDHDHGQQQHPDQRHEEQVGQLANLPGQSGGIGGLRCPAQLSCAGDPVHQCATNGARSGRSKVWILIEVILEGVPQAPLVDDLAGAEADGVDIDSRVGNRVPP